MKIAFVHPDLGIGGAERLVIDAATGLQDLGNKVTVYTSYRDKSHCFDEARDGTLEVKVRGDSIFPANISGRFSIICAILRQLHLAVSLLRDVDQPDAIFIDQLSAAIPLFRLFRPDMKILFYCHFPDKLLAQRTSLIKRLYRIPFDSIEGWSTSQADTIVVNSKFTASVFREAFTNIQKTPKVLYPCVDVEQSFSSSSVNSTRRIILSINRFERKKNLGLALESFALMRDHDHFSQAVLVIAGGYDDRVIENISYHKELVRQCESLELSHTTLRPPYDLPLKFDNTTNVYFLLSIPADLKNGLLSSSTLLAYTPEREHFGIVPIEASLAKLPVLAQNNGGPLETVDDGLTGFLRPAKSDLWQEIFQKVLFDMSDDDRRSMGERGRSKVLERFSHARMSKDLNFEMHLMLRTPTPPRRSTLQLILVINLILTLFTLMILQLSKLF